MARRRNLTPEMFIAAVKTARKNCRSQKEWERAVKLTRETVEFELPHCLEIFDAAVMQAEMQAI